MPKKIEISHKTIIFTAVFLLALWFIFQIREILFIVFIAFIFMSAFHPAVDRMEKLRIPRGLAILFLYLVFWSALGGIFAGIVPGVVEQSGKLLRVLPDAVKNLDFVTWNQSAISNQVIEQAGTLPANLLKLTVGFFGNVLNVFTTIVLSFYLLLERKYLNHYLELLFGESDAKRAVRLVNDVERRLGSWVRGELILMAAVGVLTYIGLIVLGVELALPLAVIAGLLELVPNIGPTIAAIPAVMVAFAIHPFLALSTAALYFLIQFLENNLLVPKIMQKAVGVNPLLSILALMIGFKMAGAMGAILAIPTIIIIQSVVREFGSLRDTEKLLG